MSFIRSHIFETVCATLFIALLFLAHYTVIGPNGETALHVMGRDFVLASSAIWEWVIKPTLALASVVRAV